jgi:hypothetical protein
MKIKRENCKKSIIKTKTSRPRVSRHRQILRRMSNKKKKKTLGRQDRYGCAKNAYTQCLRNLLTQTHCVSAM